MRDPKRIKIILKEIEKIWKEEPDLRLCQLIGNVAPGDNYYVEDDVLLERLKKVYGGCVNCPLADHKNSIGITAGDKEVKLK